MRESGKIHPRDLASRSRRPAVGYAHTAHDLPEITMERALLKLRRWFGIG
jgi:hypothetical protein